MIKAATKKPDKFSLVFFIHLSHFSFVFKFK